MSTIKTLFQKLENNTEALKSLESRFTETTTSLYYTHFKTESERLDELDWIYKIQQRVLRMRVNILSEISNTADIEIDRTLNVNKELKSA